MPGSTAFFGARVDLTRRAILAQREGDAAVTELASPFTIKLPAVMKHLEVLDEAGSSHDRKSAALSPCVSPDPMREAMDWFRRYESFWSQNLDRPAAYAKAQEKAASERGE